jgi:regulator of protease activity HflC (stomatin/prohibitin superfamily)
MSEGIAKLFELVGQFWGWLVPFAIIDEYQRGIVMRLGRYRRTLEPGFHWVWPLGVERVIEQQVAWNTSALHDQSLTTLDGHQVSVSAVLTWRVHDVRKFLIDVMDQDAVLADVTYGAVARHVCASPWGQLTAPDALEVLAKEVRRRAFRYGMEVSQVQFANVTKSRSIRLLGMRA